MTDTTKPTLKEIWGVLSKVDVSDVTQELDKGSFSLTYLSWAWAWGVMMEHYPQFTIEWHGEKYCDPLGGSDTQGSSGTKYPDVFYYTGGTAMVECTVHIDNVNRNCWLPVMNYKNEAQTNPDTRAISDAKQRCMTKCFALLGLGHYIYAGEDVPGVGLAVGAMVKKIQEVGLELKELDAEIPTGMRKMAQSAIKSGDADDLKAIISKMKDLLTATKKEVTEQ